MPINEFEINYQELFDFNVVDLALEVEMEKIRNEGTNNSAYVSRITVRL